MGSGCVAGGYPFLPVSSAFTGLAVAGTGLTSVVIVCFCVLVLSTFLPLFVRGVAQFATPDT